MTELKPTHPTGRSVRLRREPLSFAPQADAPASSLRHQAGAWWKASGNRGFQVHEARVAPSVVEKLK